MNDWNEWREGIYLIVTTIAASIVMWTVIILCVMWVA